ncbi:MFS transporter [Caballeronia insecticola]|uniref:Major facilitator superfamily MFS_1 n=1 Tax=Caballeronia insecticola TaxID=758793 RepID=R4WTZ5_9BURK|nr:MFS transporter [Caballeronia insecticola]BAN28078.1 major facilitator superfamily MFS_1 [Caballeronia insecticola]
MRLGWYSSLTSVERRTFWACFAGFGLDSMDATIFSLVIPALITTLGLTHPEVGYLATAALLGTAIGGWGAGILADKIGRVRILQFTILWVAVSTIAAAFATSFPVLFGIRFLQGLGYGGEAAVGGVLISEVIRPALRGRVAASVQSGYALGYAVSVALLPIIASMFPEQFGWRVFFALGVVPAGLVFFIRRLVPESGVYSEAKAAREKGAAQTPFWEIFAQAHMRRTVAAVTMATGIFGGAYVMITWLPTYLRTTLHLSVGSSAGYLACNILGSLVGPLLYGWLSDRVGRRPAFMTFLVLQAANVAVYLLAPIGAGVTVLLSFFLGAFQGALASGMLPTFAELFPTNIRASGQGFCLGGGRGFGSIVPATVGLLAASLPLGTAMGTCALCAYGVAFAAALFLPETSGTDLHETANKLPPHTVSHPDAAERQSEHMRA